MSTLQERQKKRAANHGARVADSKKSLGQKVGNFFTRRNTASASAPANKRMTTYKVFKGYTPKNKRRLPFGNDRNIVWDLAVNKPNDGVVNKAKARYLKLLADLKKGTLKDNTELYTLYQLLKDKDLFGNIKEGPTGGIARNYRNEIQYNAPTPAAAPAAAATVGSTPAFPGRPPGLDPKRARAAAAAKAASAAAASSAPAAAPASAPANAAANAAASAPAAAAASAPAPAPSAAPAAAPSPSAAPANAAAPAAASAPANAAKPSSAAAPANAANSGNPTPPASGATSINSNAGDPESIEGTIKKMKCTVCKSQEIISRALNTPVRPCNNCGSTNLNAAAAASPELEKKAREQITNYTKASNFISQYEELSAEEKTHLNAINHVKYSVAKKMINSRPLQAAPVVAAPVISSTYSKDLNDYVQAIGRNNQTAANAVLGRNSVTSEMVPKFMKIARNGLEAFERHRPKPINTSSTSGGRRSRRRHRKTSRRTKNKRSTRRR